MINKKTISLLLIIILSVSFTTLASAQAKSRTKNKAPQYTRDQQICIAENQREALKSEQEEFASIIKDAVETRRIASENAQKITNPQEKAAAIKLLNQNYNDNPTVKSASEKHQLKIEAARKAAVKKCTGISYFFRSVKNVFGRSAAALASSTPINADNKNNSKKPQQNIPQYTDQQKECLKSAQQKRETVMGPATKAMQDATKEASQARKEAIDKALKIKDKTKQQNAMKSANDEYIKNPTIIEAKKPYEDAMKSANSQFAIDQKACIGDKPLKKGFFKKIGEGFSNFGNGIKKIFTGGK